MSVHHLPPTRVHVACGDIECVRGANMRRANGKPALSAWGRDSVQHQLCGCHTPRGVQYACQWRCFNRPVWEHTLDEGNCATNQRTLVFIHHDPVHFAPEGFHLARDARRNAHSFDESGLYRPNSTQVPVVGLSGVERWVGIREAKHTTGQ